MTSKRFTVRTLFILVGLLAGIAGVVANWHANGRAQKVALSRLRSSFPTASNEYELPRIVPRHLVEITSVTHGYRYRSAISLNPPGLDGVLCTWFDSEIVLDSTVVIFHLLPPDDSMQDVRKLRNVRQISLLDAPEAEIENWKDNFPQVIVLDHFDGFPTAVGG